MDGPVKKALWPYLSSDLRRVLDDASACQAEYVKLHPPRQIPGLPPEVSKPPFVEAELFTRSPELPTRFEVQELIDREDSIRVTVKFTYEESFETYGRPPDPAGSFSWRGVVVLVHDERRLAIDDFYRLADAETDVNGSGIRNIFENCDGPHWVGTQ